MLVRFPVSSLIGLVFCFATICPSAGAGPAVVWSAEKLLAAADVVVIATASSSRDENHDSINPDSVIVVHTTFKPVAVLKGKLEESFSIRHCRYVDRSAYVTVIDGPGYVEFDTSGRTTYLLFLKKLDGGQYGAVSGQSDANLSVKVLQDYAYPSGSAGKANAKQVDGASDRPAPRVAETRPK